MNDAPSNNEASSGTSALDDGLERIYKDAMHDMQIIKARITELQGGGEPDLWQFVSSVLSVSLSKAAIYEREACARIVVARAAKVGHRALPATVGEACATSILARSNAKLNGGPPGPSV